MAPIPWNPDRKTLAEFSEAWMFVLGMMLAPLSLWKGNLRLAVGLWLIAVAGRLVGLVRPQAMRPVFVGMTLATWPIGWVVSNLLLAIVYYGVVTPIGWVRGRFGGRDFSGRPDASADSYWVARPHNDDLRRYFWQF
jgi:hypothetical protein